MKNIYIASPSHHYTGGTLLLHQLCLELIKLGTNARMLYPNDNKNTIHPNFKKLLLPSVYSINDCKENLLISPEISIQNLFKYKKVQHAIWWLSVDNFYKNLDLSSVYFGLSFKVLNFFHSRSICVNFINKLILIKANTIFKRENTTHLTQSFYAKQFLENKKVDAVMLTDYLDDSFLSTTININTIARQDNVLYNPRKGVEITKKLIELAPEIKWLPLVNYSPEEMNEILKNSKLYIDFGEHPGKDRIPREAAINGCCIITGKKGAAANDVDIPIPSHYKFEDGEENLINIIKTIKDILNNYESHSTSFNEYREIIRSEKKTFIQEVEDFKNLYPTL